MRVLLAGISTYLPSYTGAAKANRITLESLAARGHQCQAVTGMWHGAEPLKVSRRVIASLEERQVRYEQISTREILYSCNGVHVHAIEHIDRLRQCVEEKIRDFQPDWIFISSGDPSDFLLELCVKICPERVIYLAHATLALPFGPGAFNPSFKRAAQLRAARGIVAPSEFVQRYLSRWAGLTSFVFRFPVYGTPSLLEDPDSRKLVTLINPCAVKGMSIFENLVHELPQVQFGAVPTWGTSREDKLRLASYPNITLLEPSENVDAIFSHVSILLVPSLWDEAFGQVAVEAMQRGIPVISSDAGGLPEASLGVAKVIPVRRIRHYQHALDDRYMPIPDVSPQAIKPWKRAVLRLFTDPELYRSISVRSRAAAVKFAREATIDKLERFLSALAGCGKMDSAN